MCSGLICLQVASRAFIARVINHPVCSTVSSVANSEDATSPNEAVAQEIKLSLVLHFVLSGPQIHSDFQ